MGNLTPDESKRFKSKYSVDALGCWVWNGPLDKDGYGAFYLRRKNRRAHRVGWFDAFGPVGEGLVINHKCRNRACVNWQHLECVTTGENALKDSTAIGAINARKTHCPRGHTYDGSYINRTTGKAQRVCKTCEREKSRRLRAKWNREDTLRV